MLFERYHFFFSSCLKRRRMFYFELQFLLFFLLDFVKILSKILVWNDQEKISIESKSQIKVFRHVEDTKETSIGNLLEIRHCVNLRRIGKSCVKFIIIKQVWLLSLSLSFSPAPLSFSYTHTRARTHAHTFFLIDDIEDIILNSLLNIAEHKFKDYVIDCYRFSQDGLYLSCSVLATKYTVIKLIPRLQSLIDSSSFSGWPLWWADRRSPKTRHNRHLDFVSLFPLHSEKLSSFGV